MYRSQRYDPGARALNSFTKERQESAGAIQAGGRAAEANPATNGSAVGVVELARVVLIGLIATISGSQPPNAAAMI